MNQKFSYIILINSAIKIKNFLEGIKVSREAGQQTGKNSHWEWKTEAGVLILLIKGMVHRPLQVEKPGKDRKGWKVTFTACYFSSRGYQRFESAKDYLTRSWDLENMARVQNSGPNSVALIPLAAPTVATL